MSTTSTTVLLGPQQPTPNLGAALGRLGLRGPLAVITAGWQEREGEVAELTEHLGLEIVDLELYRRGQLIFRRDPAFAEAWRARQQALQQHQRLYRLRLAHALAAARELSALTEAGESLARGGAPEQARLGAIAAIRSLDRQHERALTRIHATFAADHDPGAREVVAEQRSQVAERLRPAEALLISGGHVAILRNRLDLFGIGDGLGERPLIAWSAGAMVLARRVVLFHDSPPQGPGDPELFEVGLGRCLDVLPLPHASRRLDLADRGRVGLFAARFADLDCLTFDPGAVLHLEAGKWRWAEGVRRLRPDGGVEPALPRARPAA